jgi:hypothetical protein
MMSFFVELIAPCELIIVILDQPYHEYPYIILPFIVWLVFSFYELLPELLILENHPSVKKRRGRYSTAFVHPTILIGVDFVVS